MKTLGIVGFGQFGRFIAPYLSPHFDVAAYDPAVQSNLVPMLSMREILSRDIIMLAIPAQHHKSFWLNSSGLVNPEATIIDVSSVKELPLQLMSRYAPKTCSLIGIHPLFGPQSGKNGIINLKATITNERCTDRVFTLIEAFLSHTLGLKVIQMTAAEHDEHMAYVQGLTFFIGKAFNEMDVPDSILKTPTYQHLLNIKEIVGNDSEELYHSIQTQNKYAKEVRKQFLKTTNQLETDL